MPPSRHKKRRASKEDAFPVEAPPPPAKPLPVIKVVGISGSGKSTLVHALRAAGYDARSVSQEHSNVPNLWQQFGPTAYLIYLNISLEDQQARRQDIGWSAVARQEEVRRLAHAHEHADLRIDTGSLTPTGVFDVVSSYLTRWSVRRADHPLQPLPTTGASTPPPSKPVPPTPEA